jgi:hypothetical protein
MRQEIEVSVSVLHMSMSTAFVAELLDRSHGEVGVSRGELEIVRVIAKRSRHTSTTASVPESKKGN